MGDLLPLAMALEEGNPFFQVPLRPGRIDCLEIGVAKAAEQLTPR
jgi:hypothetical protein